MIITSSYGTILVTYLIKKKIWVIEQIIPYFLRLVLATKYGDTLSFMTLSYIYCDRFRNRILRGKNKI